MPEHERWQLDGSAPELYERYLVPAITSVWAADLIDRAALQPEARVLDVACGTGAVTRLAAERVTKGRVVGLDLNAGMLAVARSLRINAAAPIEWREASALELPFPTGSFDVVLCQLGLQFFPDRPKALREMRRVMAPSGRVALSVYSAIERTPAAHAFAQALDRRFGPDASSIKRAEHVFASADEVGRLIAEQGFDEVKVHTVTKNISFPSVMEYVRFQLVATPMAELLRDMHANEREDELKLVAAETAAILAPGMALSSRLSFPQEAHVAVAQQSYPRGTTP
jgi:ubiquinone/menaquinone biosynthesis C-methylase UbiE